jgi:hypothetical protein
LSQWGRLARLLGALLVVSATPVVAAEWGAIVPGTSTKETVRAQYGEPSKTEPGKVEGYDTMQWVYEGDRAPHGIRRMAVDFGLLTGSGFRAEVVRLFKLNPSPGVFTRNTVLTGWGPPARLGKEGDAEVFFYDEGLIVWFGKDGWLAQEMVFTPPQPHRAP